MSNRFIPYNSKLKDLARKLRNNSTPSEVILWHYLKNGKMLRYDFHRQKPLLNYIVDFYCPKLQLVIEIDGATHNEKIEEHEIRQKQIERYGVTFLRFLDRDVRMNIEGVVRVL